MEEVKALEKKVKAQKRHRSGQKLLFVHHNRVKLSSAANASRLARGVVEYTARKWAKRLKDRDWNILNKEANKVNRRKSQLEVTHKVHFLVFSMIVLKHGSLMQLPLLLIVLKTST